LAESPKTERAVNFAQISRASRKKTGPASLQTDSNPPPPDDPPFSSAFCKISMVFGDFSFRPPILLPARPNRGSFGTNVLSDTHDYNVSHFLQEIVGKVAVGTGRRLFAHGLTNPARQSDVGNVVVMAAGSRFQSGKRRGISELASLEAPLQDGHKASRWSIPAELANGCVSASTTRGRSRP
jgi:hypothetical protein